MDQDEIKAQLRDVISSFIKDDPETANQNLHAVLSAKMRERVNPTPVETEDETAARIAAEEEAAAEAERLAAKE
jgi:hypothetical protein